MTWIVDACAVFSNSHARSVLSTKLILEVGVFFFKQKTAYEMRISDWSSDVCSSDLGREPRRIVEAADRQIHILTALVEREAQRRPARRAEWEIGRASCRERVCQYV